ncbi:HAMP domain-containing protein [Caldichromatium japonicum]|uniref:histidine kinase n=1 Tax=Caldichromatium japonicum TaxID=2699430 RepID=A0A6G7V9B9_9GAMM|nr:ATP-binding protein [Caldichromatium japonicum]QIK36649.1 HAMP domain-containing protein [Caldichromatium japonicum]
MKPLRLAHQTALLLAAAFLGVELLASLSFAAFIMLPLAQRSTDDLAGLMILAAQTWVELPPETRPAFEHELMDNYQLALRAEPAGQGRDEWHPPYFYLLEAALSRRLGESRHLASERIGDVIWYWADIPTGAGMLAVGLPRARLATQPYSAIALALGGGFALASGFAWWLAQRISAPLARFEAAAIRIGEGEYPELLLETGPAEIVSLARRFNALACQVHHLLSARTTLLAGVSHDLRTPFARMRLALEMLRSNPSPALIERLERDIEEMNALIATLFDLARGLEREPPQESDLAILFNELAEMAATAGRQISMHCPPCPRPIARHALQRALSNLLDNALRHAPVGPIELVCVEDKGSCRLGVLDRGPGIPPERIESMFEPFQRLESSRSPQTGGVGLGLAIVRELARVNGWQVRLEPRPGGGLVAWVEIPAKSGWQGRGRP